VSTYGVALEQLCALRRHITRPQWITPSAAQEAAGLGAGLDRAVPYYWAPDLVQLLAQVAPGLPGSWLLTPDVLPTPAGFAWFTLAIAPPSVEENHPIIALNWYPHHLYGTEMLVLWAWTGDGEGHLLPVQISYWRFGTTLQQSQQNPGGDPLPECIRELAALMAASFALMHQRVLVPRATPADRPTRRRLRAIVPEPPLIRVVTLRRRAPRDPAATPHPVAWSWQWVVAGHWREQWCPARRCHQPRWILPYVKGPADKPLKAPATRLFAVVH